MRAADILTTQETCNRVNRIIENVHSHGWLVLAVAIPFYLTFLGSRTLDGHETLVAQTAREMLRNRDLVTPTFAGVPRYQKPPLAYWLASLAYWSFGTISETTARIPFAISAISLAYIIFLVTSRLFGPSSGLLAGFIQATMAWSYLYGRSALVDITLTLFVSIAILSSTMDRWSKHAGIAPWLFWCASGLAVMAKGPVALPIIFLPTLLYRWRRTRHLADVRFLTHPFSFFGLVLFLALSMAWPIAIYREDPTVINLWYGQSIDRFLEHWGPNTRPWYFYLYQVPLLTLPWTPLWIVELASSSRQHFARSNSTPHAANADEYRLLWLWFVSALVFFSISEGKREHYILPALPPLSILAALAIPKWGKMWRSSIESSYRLIRRLLLACGIGVALIGIGCGVAYSSVGFVMGAAGLMITVAIWIAFQWNRFPSKYHYAAGLFLTAITSVLLLEATLAPRLGRRSAELAMFERNQDLLRHSTRVLQFGSNDRWTIFPIDRPMGWPRSAQELFEELRANESTLLLIREDRLREVTDLVEVQVLDRTDNKDVPFVRRDELVLARPILRR